MEEIWKDIPGYEGLYQVSNQGRVKSLDKIVPGKKGGTALKRGKILKLQMSNTGYLRAYLVVNKINKPFSVHRLVAIAFIPNPNNYPMVNHKDENRLNNRVENLEWCTQSYNTRYGTAIARQIETQRRTMTTSKPCINIDTNERFISISEAARQYKVSVATLSSCLNGKSSTSAGYRWRFAS